MKVIDLRSDTVTKPSAEMRAAISAAEVGDDVYGEDPSVNRLEALAAAMLGKEAAIFVCSGTQSNLLALLAHCERGDEYIVGQQGHTYKYEGGGAAVLGSIQPQPLDYEADGSLDLGRVESAIKPDDPHFARTRLLALENTIGGRAIGRGYFDEALALARRRGLATHLDGARVCNAAVKLGLSPADLCRGFDSVSVCLSKGLGAPVGTVLLGCREVVGRARRCRKILGGAMRQAGVLAAAGLYALEHNVERLADDHANAERLAAGLARIAGLRLEPPQTNMVFVDVPPDRAGALVAHLRAMGVLTLPGTRMRLVTHLDVSAADVDRAVAAFGAFFREHAAAVLK